MRVRFVDTVQEHCVEQDVEPHNVSEVSQEKEWWCIMKTCKFNDCKFEGSVNFGGIQLEGVQFRNAEFSHTVTFFDKHGASYLI